MRRFSIRFIGFMMLVSVVISSCQKDEGVNAIDADKTAVKTDSTKKLGSFQSPGNLLAVKGTLQVKVQDSTFTFDAVKDSIAFVNMTMDGKQYYGVTAINKLHTVSFGISSLGTPTAGMESAVSGCQFLINTTATPNLQYTLTHNVKPSDFGTMSIQKLSQDTLVAKGRIHTYLAKDIKSDVAFYAVDASFDLQFK